jgi:hypothetical protein
MGHLLPPPRERLNTFGDGFHFECTARSTSNDYDRIVPAALKRTAQVLHSGECAFLKHAVTRGANLRSTVLRPLNLLKAMNFAR